MRPVLLAAEIVGAAWLMLALAPLPAHGQSLGELSAAQGIHGSLARQGVSSARGARDVVNRSLAKSTKPRRELDLDSGAPSKSIKPRPLRAKHAARIAGNRSGSGAGRSTGRGSWVTGGSSGGNASSAWLQGGGGWGTGGGGGRVPTRRRKS
jgi:hypothetical protein